jgi:hypothetical protein
MVPGFEFLQTLMKGAGAALPGMPGMAAVPGLSQWIAPTLDPEELAKRIQELKTVQFWLEQNARLLGTTVQALEVQRMTLSTLKTMNLPMADLREALKARVPEPPPPPAPKPEPEPLAATAPDKPAAAPAIDPMLWWGALTQQFTEIATQALKPGAGDTAVAQAAAAAKHPPAAKAARKTAQKTARKVARKAPSRSATRP